MVIKQELKEHKDIETVHKTLSEQVEREKQFSKDVNEDINETILKLHSDDKNKTI